MLKKILLLINLAICTSAMAFQPLIIDTDMGVDDVIAINYLLKNPDNVIKAITISCDGNAHCQPATKNMLAILKLFNKTNIPVAYGSSHPLKGSHHFNQSVLLESDTLNGASKNFPNVGIKHIGLAKDLLFKMLQKSNKPIDILAIGPLTNIAEVIQLHPSIKNKIKNIYIMGGAINVPGNINEVDPSIKNYTAEWNIYLDPYAADIVFRSGVPITLIPLDLTNQLPIDWKFYQLIKKFQPNSLLFSLFKHNEQLLKESKWYFWDPTAAVIATHSSLAHFKMMKLKIVMSPENKSGTTVIDNRNGALVRVAININKNILHILVDYGKKRLINPTNYQNPISRVD